MSDFKAKMHKIRFPLGLGPEPARGAYSAPPAPLGVFKGPTFKGKEEEEGEGKRGGKGKRRGRDGRRERKGGASPPKYFGVEPALTMLT